jgi:ParB-like chromosome segregation protein Spo0J
MSVIMSLYAQKIIQKLKQEEDVVRQYSLIVELIEDGYRPAEIAQLSGIKDYTVRHHSRLHEKLSDPVKELFLSQKISFSLARAIAGLPSKQQEAFARKAIAKHISVQSFRQSLKVNDDAGLVREMERLSEQLSQLSGLDIKIQPDKHNAQAGLWVVRYADLTMFDVICERFTGKKSLEDY